MEKSGVRSTSHVAIGKNSGMSLFITGQREVIDKLALRASRVLKARRELPHGDDELRKARGQSFTASYVEAYCGLSVDARVSPTAAAASIQLHIDGRASSTDGDTGGIPWMPFEGELDGGSTTPLDSLSSIRDRRSKHLGDPANRGLERFSGMSWNDLRGSTEEWLTVVEWKNHSPHEHKVSCAEMTTFNAFSALEEAYDLVTKEYPSLLSEGRAYFAHLEGLLGLPRLKKYVKPSLSFVSGKLDGKIDAGYTTNAHLCSVVRECLEEGGLLLQPGCFDTLIRNLRRLSRPQNPEWHYYVLDLDDSCFDACAFLTAGPEGLVEPSLAKDAKTGERIFTAGYVALPLKSVAHKHTAGCGYDAMRQLHGTILTFALDDASACTEFEMRQAERQRDEVRLREKLATGGAPVGSRATHSQSRQLRPQGRGAGAGNRFPRPSSGSGAPAGEDGWSVSAPIRQRPGASSSSAAVARSSRPPAAVPKAKMGSFANAFGSNSDSD